MNNKVVNKQIPLETIVKVANHLEDYKEILFISFEDEKLVTQIKSTNKKFI